MALNQTLNDCNILYLNYSFINDQMYIKIWEICFWPTKKCSCRKNNNNTGKKCKPKWNFKKYKDLKVLESKMKWANSPLTRDFYFICLSVKEQATIIAVYSGENFGRKSAVLLAQRIRGCNLWLASVQFSSVTQSSPTICDCMDHSTPGLPVHY